MSYDSGAPAVHNIDLTVSPGERVALVGPSGAGKSTILRVGNGLVHPTSGAAQVFGVDTSELDHRAHRPTRRRIGAVHQDFALVGSLRVAHNVAAGRLGRWSTVRALRTLVRPSDRDEIEAVLDDVGITEKLWDRTDTLSGGQQQRVAIARMLFQEPDLLLADEPVSSLDPGRSKAVLDVIVQACEADPQRALLASIHDAPLALSHFSRLVGLHQGSIVFDRPAAGVTPDMLDQLYAVETNGPR
ncbi:MAG: phosphonate ABC transporter ATP-binding protein [Acidimicrobiales bacterium]